MVEVTQVDYCIVVESTNLNQTWVKITVVPFSIPVTSGTLLILWTFFLYIRIIIVSAYKSTEG